MELADILRTLWARRLAVVLVLALAAGGAYGARQLAHSTPTGSASVQLLVDSPQSALADLQQNTVPLTTRAALLAQVMASEVVLEDIAARAGVPVAQLTAQGPYGGSGQALDTITPSEARGSQLLGERARYRLTFVAQPDEPVVTASVQGPTALAAARVAEGVLPGVQRYIAGLAQAAGAGTGAKGSPRVHGPAPVPAPVHGPAPAQRVTIRQLGPAQAGTIDSSSRLVLSAVGGLGVLLVGLLALLGIESLRTRPASARPGEDVGGEDGAAGADTAAGSAGSTGGAGGDDERQPERDLAAVG